MTITAGPRVLTSRVEPEHVAEFLRASKLEESARAFVSKPLHRVAPDTGCLYVGQGEFAVGRERIQFGAPKALGSDDATTCLLVVFRNRATGSTAVTHLDSVARVCGLGEIEHRLLGPAPAGPPGRTSQPSAAAASTTSIEVSIAGGLAGDDSSLDTVSGLISYLAVSPVEYHLVLAAVCHLNVRQSGAEAGEEPAAAGVVSPVPPALLSVPLRIPLAVSHGPCIASGVPFPKRNVAVLFACSKETLHITWFHCSVSLNCAAVVLPAARSKQHPRLITACHSQACSPWTPPDTALLKKRDKEV